MKKYILFLALVLSSLNLFAVDDELFGVNNMGRDFIFTVPPCIESDSPYDNKVLLYVSSPYRTWVNINVDAVNIHFSTQILPNRTEVIELPANEVISYSKGKIDIEIEPQVFEDYAIKINAENPISIIASIRYNQSSDAITVYPQEALGTEYILSSYNDASEYYPSISSLSSMACIVAAYDNTKIEVVIGGNDETLVPRFKKSGDTLRAILNSGDVFMLPTFRNRSDLSGTVVTATKPVAIVSGNQNTNIPLENGNSDYLANMELPVYSWGHEYLVPYYPERRYSPVVRVYAKEPNTNIYINGEWVTELSKVSGKINEGFIETRIYDNSNKSAAYIMADKPIAVSMYNTGVREDGLPEKVGGPSMVSISPIRQFQNYILVPLIEDYSHYTYEWNKISLVLPEGMNANSIQIGTKDGDKILWQPFSNIAQINKTDSFFPTSQGETYVLIDATLELSETFYLKADLPFMAYLRGASRHESYSVGAAYAFKSEDKHDTLAPRPLWTMNCNGDVEGNVVDYPDNVELASCLYPPILFADSTENYILNSEAVTSNTIQSLAWALKIKNPNLKAKAKILFVDRAGNDTIVRIEYNPIVLAFEPNIIDFGVLKSGEEVTKQVNLKNMSNIDAHVDDILLKRLSNGFEIVGSPAPFILPAGESEELTLSFRAETFGEYSDSLGVQDTCKSFYILYTHAEIGYPEIDAYDCDLGDVLANKESESTVRLFNKGKLPLIINGVKLPVNPDITVELPNIPTESDPITIPKKSYIDYIIKITASQMAEYKDSIVFYSNTIPEADSVCVIEAKGLMPGILSDNYDFGRKTKGFEYSATDQGIKIQNSGNVPITIEDVILENDNAEGVFKFNKADVCKRLGTGDVIYLPVKFMPESTKKYSLDLRYKLSDGTISKSATKLSGTGVYGKLQSNNTDIDLGIALINNANDIKKARVTITNLAQSAWEFADRVVITGLSPTDNSLGMGKDNFSNKGFAIDNSQLKFPLELMPGNAFSFDVYFRAFAEHNKAVLKVDNDINQNIIINFTGSGVEELVAVSAEPVTACYGTEEQMMLKIVNFGTNEMEFEAPLFSTPSSEFYFANPVGDFVVERDSTYFIPINYRPSSRDALSSATVEIIAKNGSPISLTKEITGTAVNINREVALQPLGSKVAIGSKAKKTVKLMSGTDISYLDIQSLHIKISYLPNFLFVGEDAVTLNQALVGYYDLQNVEIDSRNGFIDADIVSISDKVIDSGADLLDIIFDTYLSTLETTKADIQVELSSVDSECVLFNAIQGVIELQPYCAGDIAKILLNGSNLEAPKAFPNPISTDKFELSFSLGYDAEITLEIVKLDGKTVKTILFGKYKAGEYMQEVSTEDLPAGVYFIKLQSATMYLTEKLVIVK